MGNKTKLKKSKNTKKNESVKSYGKSGVVGGIYTYKSFIAKLFDEIRNQEKIITEWRKLLRIKQNEVNEALKQVKILEKLKEKEEKKFNDFINYQEAKEIDDIVTTRYKAKVN